MKRRYGGSSSAALSMMNTRLTYSCMPPLLLALEQIERRALRQVQQRGVFDVALDLVVRPEPRVLGIVGQVLVERLIVLVLELRFRARPERLRLVERSPRVSPVLRTIGMLR